MPQEHPNYLDLKSVASTLQIIDRNPDPTENLYKRLLFPILHSCFPEEEYFQVTSEELRGEGTKHMSKLDASVLKLLSPPEEESFYHYDYCLVRNEKVGISWSVAEEGLGVLCSATNNEFKQVYGMVQIGLEVQIYRADHGKLDPLGGRLNLRHDVDDVTAVLQHMEKTPLPVLASDSELVSLKSA